MSSLPSNFSRRPMLPPGILPGVSGYRHGIVMPAQAAPSIARQRRSRSRAHWAAIKTPIALLAAGTAFMYKERNTRTTCPQKSDHAEMTRSPRGYRFFFVPKAAPATRAFFQPHRDAAPGSALGLSWRRKIRAIAPPPARPIIWRRIGGQAPSSVCAR